MTTLYLDGRGIFGERMRKGDLKYRQLWLIVGWLGIGLLCYLSLTTRPHHVIHAASGDKIEHILAFAVPTLWFGQLYTSRYARKLAGFAFWLLAILLEYGQWQIGGYAMIEYDDIVASWIGIALGLLLLKTSLARLFTGIEHCLLTH